MKKILTLLMVSAVVLTSFYSCQKEQEDLFDQTSALRLEKAINDYTTVLTDAENGWVMEYFANAEYKGYIMFVKFNKDSSVKAAAWDELTDNIYTEEDETCMFQLIADNGPVLTFNTYSKILHRFADPNDMKDKGGEGTGLGFEGDYEFMMISPENQANEVMMKGKKSGSYIRMRPIPEGVDWKEHFRGIKDMEKKLANRRIPNFWLSTTTDGRYELWDMKGKMNACPENGDKISEKKSVSYIVTESSIRFCVPFEGNNEKFKVQSFELADGIFRCTDDDEKESFISAPSATEMYTNTMTWQTGWDIHSDEGIGGELQSLLAAIEEEAQNKFGSIQLIFKEHQTQPTLYISIKGKYRGSTIMAVEKTDDNKVAINVKDSDKYWNTTTKFIPTLNKLAEYLNGKVFKLEASDKLQPTKIKLINEAAEADFITITID